MNNKNVFLKIGGSLLILLVAIISFNNELLNIDYCYDAEHIKEKEQEFLHFSQTNEKCINK